MHNTLPFPITMKRLKGAHRKVVAVVDVDPAFVPIFLRLEQKIAAMAKRPQSWQLLGVLHVDDTGQSALF